MKAVLRELRDTPVDPKLHQASSSMKLNPTFFAAILLNTPLTSFAALLPDLHGRNSPSKSTTTALASSAPPAATLSAQSINATTLQDMQTIHERRLTSIIGALTSPNSIPGWCVI